MKDAIKLLMLLIPVIKDLVNLAGNEDSITKKKRILKIMEDQDLTKLEKMERILFRKAKVKVEVLGFVKGGELLAPQHITRAVVVNERLIEHYYHLASIKHKGG